MKRSSSYARRTTYLCTFAAGLALAASALAQKPAEEVTVKAKRSDIVGRSSSGVPIREVSLEARVAFDDLDLTSAYGAHVLEQRVKQVAADTCKKLVVDFPAQGSTDETCTKAAIDDAMPQVKAVVDAAKAKAKK